MAKQRYGINDGYRGTVGTVIGYEWRGQWCLRSRPRRVRNPRTERQRMARGLFSQVSQLASRMATALRIGLHTEAVRMHRTECNHFMSINSDCFTLDGGRLAVDYEELVVSLGPVAPVGFISDERGMMSDERGMMSDERGVMSDERGVMSDERGMMSDERVVTVPFEKNPLHLCSSGDDQVYLWAWCAELDEGVLSVPAYRKDKQVSVELPERWAGCEVHLYGFVEDYAGRTSDSSYIGCGRVPYEEYTAATPHQEEVTNSATGIPLPTYDAVSNSLLPASRTSPSNLRALSHRSHHIPCSRSHTGNACHSPSTCRCLQEATG